MSERVLIRDLRDGAVADVEPINEALVVQGEVHTNIHRGRWYTASKSVSVASSGTEDFLIVVDASVSMHARFSLAVQHTMAFSVYEQPTVSANGSAITTVNRNRFSANTPTGVIYSAPTVTGVGTLMFDGYIPGGDKHTASGGTGGGFEEWILKTGFSYLFRVSNTLISPAAAGNIGLIVDWYEPV